MATLPNSASSKRCGRLLFVDNEVSDFLSHRRALARAASERGFEVHVAIPDEPGIERVVAEGYPVHVISMKRKSSRPWDEAACLLSLYRLYRRVNPQIIHHIRLKPVLYGGIAARFTPKIAVVGMLTGLGHLFSKQTPMIRLMRSGVRVGLKTAFHHKKLSIIFQNPDDRQAFIEQRLLRPEETVIIKGSGVDLSAFTPSAEPASPPVILMASRMLWNKGVGEFVAAAKIMKNNGVHATFILAGQPDAGHPDTVSAAQLEEWNKCGIVEWWGLRTDMASLMGQAHIVCLPSKYGEGIPRVLIEAAASGRPSVTTDSPGCREIVRQGQNGLLVPVGDSAALAQALTTLIEDRPLREAMGRRGRQIAEAEFSLHQVIEETLTVYRRLLSKAVA